MNNQQIRLKSAADRIAAGEHLRMRGLVGQATFAADPDAPVALRDDLVRGQPVRQRGREAEGDDHHVRVDP